MYATANKKMLNMIILGILKEYSDESHRLTQQEIIRKLKALYHMECDRRSVKNNIEYLQELGYDISTDGGYYLETREFDDAELRMLIDSVLFSKSLTQKQSKALVDKLCAMEISIFLQRSHIFIIYRNFIVKIISSLCMRLMLLMMPYQKRRK